MSDRAKVVLVRSCEVSSRGRARIPSPRVTAASGPTRGEKHLLEESCGVGGTRLHSDGVRELNGEEWDLVG